MHGGELARQQSVAGHHEEDAALSEHESENDGRNADDDGEAERGGDGGIPDLAQDEGERLAGTGELVYGNAPTAAVQTTM